MNPIINGILPYVAIAVGAAACATPTPKAAEQVVAAQPATASSQPPAAAVENNAGKQADFAAPGGRMGGHGMIVFGDASGTWMSHIPMFHTPHDAQVILQVALSGDGLNPPDMSDANFTFAPDDFSLNDLVSGRIASFTGALFRGNFEQGGVEIAKQVKVKVVSVLLAKVLQERAGMADGGDFFLIAGMFPKSVSKASSRRTQIAWAIHQIDSAPGYDIAAKVTLTLNPGQEPITSQATGYRFANDANSSGIPKQGQRGYFRLAESKSLYDARFLAIGSCLIGPDFTKPCP
jgi:hypothetical protein